MLHINKEFRINERIRTKECRLVDENGEQLGIVPIKEALALSKERGLDLIEVAPSAAPPVCKIMDYGKYKYEQGKREREASKKQHVSEMKNIRMRPGIDEHDYQFKLKHVIKFLKDGHKVKISMVFRSREISHPEVARRSLDRMAQDVSEYGVVEKPSMMEGKTMIIIFSPK